MLIPKGFKKFLLIKNLCYHSEKNKIPNTHSQALKELLGRLKPYPTANI